MCGIAGKLFLRSAEPVRPDAILRMCEEIRHRGPDDYGLHVDGAFGMGMRRLSIIDLSTGNQPIHNEDRSVWTVFNGELYNYQELREQLEQRGHSFYTQSDTEVIVHLYEEHGREFAKDLAGMFAIAVWDARRRELVLARDRLGIKPLYYSVDSERVVFASEIKAILADGVDREIDLQALHDYLSLNYVPGPASIFSAVRKLPPGHTLTCSERGVTAAPYWTLDCATVADDARTEDSYSEELHALLKTVVKQHLLSDVPLGVFLSGGLDSSSLVALMRQVSSQPIRTFSIGFEEQSYDELDSARRVAREFETDHHELVVRPKAADLLPDLVRHFDEPFADSSAIPVYCVSRLAREHVKVALSGEGGDEVFAGYETYAAHRIAELYKRLPRILSRTAIPAVIRRLPVSHRRVSFDYKARRFLDGAFLPPADALYGWKVIFTEEAKAALYANGADGLADSRRLFRAAYDECGASDPLTRLQYIDTKIYLPDDLLVKADRMSMAVSLEARVPFLDHRLVELMASWPRRLKLRGLTKKYILKRTMSPYLPSRIVNGKKRGFNVPIPVWIGGELRELVNDVLSPTRIREAGFFRPEVVAEWIRGHHERRRDNSRNLFGLLMFMLWHEEYVRRPAAGTGQASARFAAHPGMDGAGHR